MGAKHDKVKKSMQRVDHGKKIAVILLYLSFGHGIFVVTQNYKVYYFECIHA
jgi:hypothetical protein